MSWKSVEMQIALPRTQDAGQLQEQMSKQHQRFQESLAQNQLKKDLLKRRQVPTNERTTGKTIKEKQERESSKQSNQEQHKRQTNKEEQKVEHPYLGKIIDFSR